MRIKFWDIDLGLLIPVFILLILSFTALSSISLTLVKNQIIFAVIGIFALIFFSQINYKIIQRYAIPIYVVSIFLLLLVLLLGIESRGAIRWIEIAGFRIQLSEILKPFLAISLSTFLVSRRDLGIFSLLQTFVLLLVIAFLIFFQPDLGSALIYIIATVLTLIFVGFPLRYFLSGALFFIISAPIFWSVLRSYQRERILNFLNPGHDPLGGSYNAIQSIIAVGSGMVMGRGLGQGTQSGLSFLPERHTDFIFATISEQLGFIGSIIILAAFAYLLFRIFKISVNSEDQFCRIFTVVSFFIILVQSFINIGMNTGLLPIVGVTLPFVSYGGSSLVSSFILLGLISSADKSRRNPEVLEIR